MTFDLSESSESQYQQAEERGNKLKQMLVKTKKDLSDAKKLVCILQVWFTPMQIKNNCNFKISGFTLIVYMFHNPRNICFFPIKQFGFSSSNIYALIKITNWSILTLSRGLFFNKTYVIAVLFCCQEGEQRSCDAQIRGQMEVMTQQNEEQKVRNYFESHATMQITKVMFDLKNEFLTEM